MFIELMKNYSELMKIKFIEIDYWIRACTITTNNKKINLCGIRFYLELRDSRYKSYIQSNINEF